MKKRTVGFLVFLMAIALILCSCSEKLEQIDISDRIITDLKCYKLDDKFNIEKFEMSIETLQQIQGYGIVGGCFDNCVHLLNTGKNRTFGILRYDYVLDEITEIKKEDNPSEIGVYYSLAYAEKDVVFYFKSTATEKEQKLELFRIDIPENKEECIFSFNDTYYPTHNGLLYFNGELYFNDFFDSETEQGKYTAILYKHNIANNKTDIYMEDAESPKIYNDRIVFVRDDNYTDGENIILDPNKEGETRVYSVFFDDNTRGYTVSIYEEDVAVAMALGVYDDSDERKEIARTDPSTASGFAYAGRFEGMLGFKEGRYPILYDPKSNVLYSTDLVFEGRYGMRVVEDCIILNQSFSSTDTKGENEEIIFYRITAK